MKHNVPLLWAISMIALVTLFSSCTHTGESDRDTSSSGATIEEQADTPENTDTAQDTTPTTETPAPEVAVEEESEAEETEDSSDRNEFGTPPEVVVEPEPEQTEQVIVEPEPQVSEPVVEVEISETVIIEIEEEFSPVLVSSGNFTTADVATSGTVSIISEENRNVLKLSNFSTERAPDLFIYLSTNSSLSSSSDLKGSYRLARLQSASGNQTYEIPDDIDISQYKSAAIHCRLYNKSFGFATLR